VTRISCTYGMVRIDCVVERCAHPAFLWVYIFVMAVVAKSLKSLRNEGFVMCGNHPHTHAPTASLSITQAMWPHDGCPLHEKPPALFHCG
jgi:hypothetical protein